MAAASVPLASRLLRPTAEELWTGLAILLPAVGALAAPMSTVDLAYAIRAGDLIREGGRLLTTEPFAFTLGASPWLDQQWGSQIVLSLVHSLGSWELLAVLRAAVTALAFLVVLGSIKARGVGGRAAAIGALVAFLLAAPALALRAQSFGLLAAAVVGGILARRDRSPRLLALVPVVAVLWANLHGSFVLAPALVAAAAVDDAISGRPVRRVATTVATGGLTLLATFVTPWGPAVWGYAADLTGSPLVRTLVGEWRPLDPASFPGILVVVLAALSLALVVRAARSAPRCVPWGSVVLVAGLVALAFQAERGVVWAALVGSVVLTPLVGTAGRRTKAARPRRLPNGLILGGIAFIGVALMPWWRPLTGGPVPLLADAPTGVTRTLIAATSPGDRLFVPQRLASWFELTVPGRLVVLDSRVERFPPAVFEDYLAVEAGSRDTQAILDRWDVAAVVATVEGPLAGELASSDRWARVGVEETLVVFVAR